MKGNGNYGTVVRQCFPRSVTICEVARFALLSCRVAIFFFFFFLNVLIASREKIPKNYNFYVIDFTVINVLHTVHDIAIIQILLIVFCSQSTYYA